MMVSNIWNSLCLSSQLLASLKGECEVVLILPSKSRNPIELGPIFTSKYVASLASPSFSFNNKHLSYIINVSS